MIDFTHNLLVKNDLRTARRDDLMLFLPEFGLAPKNISRDGASHMRGMGIYADGLGMRVQYINVELV